MMAVHSPSIKSCYRFLAFILGLSLLTPSFGSSGTWATKTPIPTKRYMFVSETVDGKIYVIGGYDGGYFATNEEYDPVADSWSTKVPMSQAREGAASGVVNGKIYVIGGNGSGVHYRNVEEYDPVGNSWSSKTPIPVDFEQGAGAAVNGKVYAIGGFDGTQVLSTVWEYDPVADSWTEKNPMPTARNYIQASVLDGKIYVIGGGDGTQALSTVEAYDPVADTWTTKASMPVARHSGLNIAANGKIYYIGGTIFSTEVLEYDPASDAWTNCDGICNPMPTGRMYLNGNVVGGKIYAISGQIEGGGYTMTNVVEEYTPPPGLVAYYPFNGNANDESGNGNDGTVNGPVLTEDRFGNANSAYSFDGEDDDISLPFTSVPDDITVSLWMYMNTLPVPGTAEMRYALYNIFEDDHGAYNIGYGSEDTDYRLRTLVFNGGPTSGWTVDESIDTLLAINTWYHFSFSYSSDSEQLKTYINGQLVSTLNSVSPPSGDHALADTESHLGGSYNDDYWGADLDPDVLNGRIDDIYIYTRELASTEIEALYHEGGWDVPAVWHVSTGGDDGNAGTASEPLRNIQTALLQAVDNDTIKVAAGTYQEGLISQSKVVMLGGYDASFAEAERNIFAHKTNIQGVSTTVFTDNHGCTVDGFDFDGNGACDLGLRLTNGSVLTHNVIRGATKLGASAVETNGGAVVVNNTIVGSSGPGLDIYSGSGTPVIKNNIIANNGFGINTIDYSAAVRTYNDVHENAFNYIGFDDNPGVGDITLNPLFVDGANGDFRLQETSPCIDRGDPDTQYNDPDGSRNDMGAYYYQQPVEPPTIVSTTPAQNALNVAQDAAISVTFNMDMEASSINATTFVVNASQTGRLSGTYSYDSGDSITTFTPDSPLKVGEVVSVTLTTGVQSAAGEALENPYVWAFTVEVDGGSGTFTAQTTYTAGNAPVTVGIADLDDDGNLDLATSNWYSDDISVWLGNGDGTFASQTTYAAGDGPHSLHVADLDGDGDLDLATANSLSDNVSVLLGNGDGTFAAQTTYAAGDLPKPVRAADLNGDGNLDLAVGNNNSNTVSVLLGNGDGTFTAQTTYAVDYNPWSMYIADLDGDGNLDLTTSSEGDNVSVLLGNGDGTFAAKTTYAAGDGTFSVYAADLNGDGDLDLATANYGSNDVSVLLGNGDGTFATQTTYAAGDHTYSVHAADLNGDGNLDLAATNNYASSISVLSGNGDGTFAAQTTYAAGDRPYTLSAADLDGDGDLDLVTANFDSDNISVLLNTGEPTPPAIVSTAPTQNTLNVAQDAAISVKFDMDMDAATINANTFVVHGSQTGKLGGTYSYDSSDSTATFTPDSPLKVGEVVSVTLTTGVQSAAGEALASPYTWSFTTEVLGGSGEFEIITDYGTGSYPNCVFSTDLDGDGNPDLAATNYYSNTVSVLMNSSDGTFQDRTDYGTGGSPLSVFSVDLDGDGDPDLAIANQSDNTVSILLNNGDGTFQDKTDYGTGSSPHSVFSIDLDGDGDLDLAVANDASNTVSILLNHGDATFQIKTDYVTGSVPLSVFSTDLDGDGYPDLLVANNISNTVSVLLNNGDGTFQARTDYGTGSETHYVFSTDLDSDGDQDLAVANNGSNTVSVLLNNGDGTFDARTDYGTGSSPHSVFSTDLDGDGDLDLAVANWGSNSISVLPNNGDGIFQTRTDYGIGSNPHSVFSADLDGDGDQDLVTGNSNSDNISVLLNSGGAPPVSGLVAYYPFNGNANDESGNGNDGTVYGATLAEDRFGNAGSAYSFDGADDYIQCIQPGPEGDSPRTLTFWAKSPSFSIIKYVFAYGGEDLNDSAATYHVGFGSVDECECVRFDVAHSAATYPDGFLSTQWYNIAVVIPDLTDVSVGDVMVYKNGILLGSRPGFGDLKINTKTTIPINIGRSYGDEYYFDGTIDDIRLYSRALSIVEIEALYHEGGWSPHEGFTAVTSGPVVSDGGSSMGSSWGDYDNDGDLDLFVANGSQNNFLYENSGDGTFTRNTAGPVVTDGGNSAGSSWGDYDNDGDLDLFVPNNGNNFLYTNNGDGNFTKVTTGPPVSDGDWSMCSSWGDYDNDGDLDLFVANYNQNNLLYTNNNDGTFARVTTGPVISEGGLSYGSCWGDYDNDGDLDLFVPNNGNNFLYTNNGDGTFAPVTTGSVISDGGDSHGSSWADYDNDGDLDLFVANWNENNFLYENSGDGTFTRTTSGPVVSDGGYSFGSCWGDYDNDGDLDLFVANTEDQDNFLYTNNGDGTFSRVTGSPLTSSGCYSNGAAWGDYDNDGDLDLFVANSGNNILYANNGSGNHWMNLQLVGTQSNVSAIGAKVRIKTTIFASPVWQLNEISGQTGGGGGGQNSLNAEFGLGDAAVIDSIRIEWPSGIVWDTTNVDVDQFLTITESLEITTSTQYISGTGEVEFPGTDLAMNFTSQTGTDTIEVQAFLTAPDGTLPSAVTLEGNRYWIITHSGSGDFSVDLTFNLGRGAFSTDDQQYPARLRLLQRDSGGTLPWEIESHGASATDSTVTFTDLTSFSQFTIGRSTDTQGPSISSEFRRVEQPDDIIEIDAYVRDPGGISSVKLHYLEGGKLIFNQADMNELNDTTYRAGVPVASTVIRGLAYFIVGTDSVGNVTTTDTTSVPVEFPAGIFTTSMTVTAFSDGFPFNKWRLISIPCDLVDTSVTNIIQAVLGVPPSDETWKIFRYTGPGRDAYLPVGRFTSGESYFLKQIVSEGIEQPVHFTLGAGQSVDLTGQSISLPSRKWSFISSPYPFVVTVTADQGTFKGPYTYGEFGSGRQEGWSTGNLQTILRPWGGYIIYNNTDQEQTLMIRPPGLAKAMLPKGNAEQIAGWFVQLTVEGERYFDTGNVIGRITGASEGLDSYDSPEPPYLEGYVSLTVENSNWEGELLRTSDIRSDETANGEWDLVLLTRNETGVINLSVGLEGDLPPQIVLVDLLERAVYDLKNDPQPIAITGYDENLPYRLKVLAGEQGFVEDATDEILAKLPEKLALAQNYPNPFNPTTTIEFALPKPGKVSLKVYNLLGQEIAILVNDWQELGYYSVTWQGRDQAGRSVASGMYFAVLRVDEHTLTRKMVLLR